MCDSVQNVISCLKFRTTSIESSILIMSKFHCIKQGAFNSQINHIPKISFLQQSISRFQLCFSNSYILPHTARSLKRKSTVRNLNMWEITFYRSLILLPQANILVPKSMHSHRYPIASETKQIQTHSQLFTFSPLSMRILCI